MKMSKSKILKLIKEAINEKRSFRDFNIDDIIGSRNPPPPPDNNNGGGGGGGRGSFIYLIALAKKLVNNDGFAGGTPFKPISSVDELLRVREKDMDPLISLDKNVLSVDGEEISLSAVLSFEDLTASFFVSCYDPGEGITNIIDGFEIEMTSNEKFIEALMLIRMGVRKVQQMSSSDIIAAGNKLLSK
jgi:hypothetical protein